MSALLSAGGCGLPRPDHKPGAGEIRFFVDSMRLSDDPEQTNTYGLSMTDPWSEDGSLFLNFPEHLEYNPRGDTILRHFDQRQSPWIISPDGRQASYRVESLALEGVIVEAFARIAADAELPPGTRGAYLAMRIANGADIALPVIRPLICMQYRKVGGFPTSTDHFRHNFIPLDGKLVALADLPTEQSETKFKGCVVAGSPQRDTRSERQGGLIERDMDLAASVVSSLDERRRIVLWWTPGKSMIANANIPCIHADPYFGTLEPGEKGFAEGLVLYAEGAAESIVDELGQRDRTAFTPRASGGHL